MPTSFPERAPDVRLTVDLVSPVCRGKREGLVILIWHIDTFPPPASGKV